MSKDLPTRLTKEARAFLCPRNATQRQYEALRAYFVDGLPSHVAAARFGYSPGSFRVLCHAFRRNLDREFFLPLSKGPQAAPKKDRARERVVVLRKQNLSIYDIARVLAESAKPLSTASVAQILEEEGFARLPRRSEEERLATTRPEPAAVADVRQLDLSSRNIRTRFGGLFLFLPLLIPAGLDRLLARAGFPGSKMIPAGQAMGSLLALKLFGSARHSHVMSYVFDEGLALWAGLNVVPKRAFLTEYSCRVHPDSYLRLMRSWFDALRSVGLEQGASFDLDFHTIPFHGEDALVQKHYVSKRSRRQKGMLAFVAQDAGTRVFCYARGDVRKEDQDDEILRFAEYWKQRTGKWPEELVFDSKLTTYANLNRLNQLGIRFMTLRRRSRKMLAEIHQTPLSVWRRIELHKLSRAYRTPRILDQKIKLSAYEGDLRQITIIDLGHEEPTLLLTNQMRPSPATLIERYAQRMLIENGIADGIDFFHMDALSSAVAMKLNCDLLLTMMASSLYRLLCSRIGHGYETAKSRHIFRDFVDATALLTLTEDEIRVRFQKRAHNPLLIAAGLADTDVRIPWLGGRRLRLAFG
jgi:hypothetical protein